MYTWGMKISEELSKFEFGGGDRPKKGATHTKGEGDPLQALSLHCAENELPDQIDETYECSESNDRSPLQNWL